MIGDKLKQNTIPIKIGNKSLRVDQETKDLIDEGKNKFRKEQGLPETTLISNEMIQGVVMNLYFSENNLLPKNAIEENWIYWNMLLSAIKHNMITPLVIQRMNEWFSCYNPGYEVCISDNEFCKEKIIHLVKKKIWGV